MTRDHEITHAISSVSVEVSPSEVDAAAELTLKAQASCTPTLDLRGQTLLIRDQHDIEIGSAKFTEFDGVTNTTGEFALKAPTKVGAYAWSAVCPAAAADGFSYDEAVAAFSITVKPHTTRVVIWQVPSATVAGEKFGLMVGIKCTSECRLTGRQFGVYDHRGMRLATGALGKDTWPGTNALYFAEVEIEAPRVEGSYQWEARAPAMAIQAPGSEDALAHNAGSAEFGVRSVPPPEFVVRVEAVDKQKQVPLKGAHVVLHPYAAFTDDQGVAEIAVPKGQYRLQVSLSKYRAIGVPVEVMGNVATRAELDLEPIVDPGDMYY